MLHTFLEYRGKISTVGSKNVELMATITFIIFFIIAAANIENYSLDEKIFHFPNMLNFYRNGLEATFNNNYSTANTPLPYIIVALVAKLSSPTLLMARMVTVIISLFTFFMAINLLRSFNTSRACYLSILFFPYFFLHSFTFYAVNYGLFFAMTVMWIYQKTKNKYSIYVNLLMGACISLGVLSQQFYLMLPCAILLWRFISLFSVTKPEIPALFRKMVIPSIALLLPLAVPIFVFLRWRGLTHPEFSHHALMFNPSNIVGICFVTGFYFAPFLLQVIRRINRLELVLAALLSAIFVLFFRPTFSGLYQGPGIFTGIIFHLISIAGKVHPYLSLLIMTALSCSGILVFSSVFRLIKSETQYVIYITCMLFFFVFVFNSEIGERHLLPMMMLLLILVLPNLKKPYSIVYPAFIAFMGIGYFYYWNFVKYASLSH